MGITGVLARSVFSKSRSIPRHDIHGHQASSKGSEKRKWSNSVRSYLCGDEHNSILAVDDFASVRNSTEAEAEAEAEAEEETDFASFRSNVATNKSTGTREFSAEADTASVRSSEATVNQPLEAESNYKLLEENCRKEKQNSTYKLFQQEDAALTIQSAFRNFMARRAKIWDDEDEEKCAASPSRESIGTSVEVQTGNSCDVHFSIKEERDEARHTIRRSGAQVLKIQDDWDDSTVSSVISKMREQSRLEAATRRERALAYAFSQQLRICSKKQNSGIVNGDEANMGWSWLERWMAARQPDMKLMNEDSSKTLVKRMQMDAAMEERESCGSNEVSSLFEVSDLPAVSVPKNLPKPINKARNSQVKRSFSRQESTLSHLSPKESKDVKKVWHVGDEKEKRKRQKQPAGSKRDVKNATDMIN